MFIITQDPFAFCEKIEHFMVLVGSYSVDLLPSPDWGARQPESSLLSQKDYSVSSLRMALVRISSQISEMKVSRALGPSSPAYRLRTATV